MEKWLIITIIIIIIIIIILVLYVNGYEADETPLASYFSVIVLFVFCFITRIFLYCSLLVSICCAVSVVGHLTVDYTR
jgi:hypothetical protein